MLAVCVYVCVDLEKAICREVEVVEAISYRVYI
jgi:hypothetical protein